MALASLILLKRWGLTPSLVRLPKLVLATLALGLGLAVPLPLLIKLLLGGGLYLGALWLLKLIPTQATAIIKERL